MSDPINPSHYTHLPAEAIDIIEAAIAKAPFNESAYLHGQVLKYLLRCWEKEGIEDLRKAKWYLDRMVALFDEVPAEASGASETPSDPPKRYRVPTQEDLANGPIDCEVRDSDSEQWKSTRLIHVHLSGSFRFLCKSEHHESSLNWNQCRIKVAE